MLKKYLKIKKENKELKVFLHNIYKKLGKTDYMCDELLNGGDFDEKLISNIYKNVSMLWTTVLRKLKGVKLNE